MKLVITYHIDGGGGTPDPMMARKVVDAVALSMADIAIRDAIAEVEDATHSMIPLGRRTIAVERDSPNIYSTAD